MKTKEDESAGRDQKREKETRKLFTPRDTVHKSFSFLDFKNGLTET